MKLAWGTKLAKPSSYRTGKPIICCWWFDHHHHSHHYVIRKVFVKQKFFVKQSLSSPQISTAVCSIQLWSVCPHVKFFGETFWIFTQMISLHIIFCHHQKKWERCMLLLCNCYCYCFSFSYCCTIVFTFWRSITRFPSFRHSSSAAGRPPCKYEDSRKCINA